MKVSLGSKETTFKMETEINASSGKKYEIGEYINRGGNAVIYECLDSNGDLFAVKFLLKTGKKISLRFKQEINAIKTINHPHIIKYIDDGCINLTNDLNKSCNVFFLIMERADSNLIEYMRNNENIGYKVYAPQFRGLSEALSNLHEIAIHRDIKPENILIKGETWLIGDLGLCSFVEGDNHIDLTGDDEKIGPKHWLSPEAINKIYLQSDSIDKYSDVYQLCAVFWFIVTKRHPMGILTKNDWHGNDALIYDVIINSLSHDYHNRPQNGSELYLKICRATIDR